ncbi:hypothetical protein ACP70R_012001 [Stipagrostis hirtigluma subsp. patula]
MKGIMSVGYLDPERVHQREILRHPSTRIYPTYRKKGGRHLPIRKEWKVVGDNRCRKQNKGNNYCGYYVWDFMHEFTNDLMVTDAEHMTMGKDSLTEQELIALTEQLFGFIMEQVVPQIALYHCFNHAPAEVAAAFATLPSARTKTSKKKKSHGSGSTVNQPSK